MLKDKKDGHEVGVSTEEWALVREQVGKPGPWETFEFHEDLSSGSLRFFVDQPNQNHFQADVLKALAEKKESWKGPSWDSFKRALSRKYTAEWTTIITARLQSPRTIHGGVELLRDKGYFKGVLAEENVFPVAYPQFRADMRGDAKNPSLAKTKVMKMTLDKLQAVKIAPSAKPVLDRDGVRSLPLHVWEFSDDDFGNFSKALSALSEGVQADPKRWSQVKIVLRFTGRNHPTEKARSVVIKSDGQARAVTASEGGETVRILNHLDKLPGCA